MRSVILALVVGGSSCAVSGQGLFLQSDCAVSRRSSVLEDDGYVAYLYLNAPGTRVPEKEVVVYSRRPPVRKNDWWALSKTGEKPLLSQDIASANAVLAQPVEHEFAFRWSKDCESVAVLRRGVPLAFLSAASKTGYAKALRKSSVVGQPWDQRTYEAIFGR